MKDIHELVRAFARGDSLVWNDPDPIPGNDYRITEIESIITDDFDEDYPINIRYAGGHSEAEVYLHEISATSNHSNKQS